MNQFTVKDSGERQAFTGGMVRDITTGKADYTLVLDGPMFERWAEHLRKGAEKYSKRNWLLAAGPEELERFKESAFRHFLQWLRGDRDEDHAAAILFNINGFEYVRERMWAVCEVSAATQAMPTKAVQVPKPKPCDHVFQFHIERDDLVCLNCGVGRTRATERKRS